MSLRAAIYARYSSDSQREASIVDQIRLCKERIIRERWELVEVYRDLAMSGATALRPGYQALLAAARDGQFEIVMAEALDRLSRDQEDTAALFKRLRFAGIRIVTLAEGEVTELHVGLKGTMNALFLKDLAAKTHRGLRGRVEAGYSGGGNAFGYRVVHGIGPDGQPVTGRRAINPAEAAVVQRIFRAYAAGESPKRIALELNAAGIPGPRGGAWSASTINGNRARGTGILNNELYAGRIVWNRLAYGKDPETGRRRSRRRSDTDRVSTAIPDLRIVSQEQWDSVKARQEALDRRQSKSVQPAPFWSKQRPRYLFSGLIRCGVCGGGFSKISANHFGCSSARNKGPTTCTSLLTIRRSELEDAVLGALQERLLDPDLFKVFAAEFVAEWNRLQADTLAGREARAVELRQLRQQIERLVDALADGTPVTAVRDRLNLLEQRKVVLETEMAAALLPAPRLHPNLPEVYRQKIAELAGLLGAEDATAAKELVRSLVEHITLIPEGSRLRIEVRGELGAILRLANGAIGANRSVDAVGEQIKMVAGTGFEPVTFRL